jgi:hypothetical protein
MSSDGNTRHSSLWVWLLGLFTVGGATLFGLPRALDQSPPAKRTEEPKNESKSGPDANGAASDTLDVLKEFLRIEPKEASKSSGLSVRLSGGIGKSSLSLTADGIGAAARTEKPLSHYLSLEPAEYEFLIATVPDPVDSKFPHEFDATVDAIERAYEARGFTVRASRLPWRHAKAQPGAAEDLSRSQREYPGVLVFRKSRTEKEHKGSERRKIALVCLVGESPISGIHKPALWRALEARKVLYQAIKEAQCLKPSDDWSKAKDAVIPIVAPYFTGSQASLVIVLQQWQEANGGCEEVSYRIINGSATAIRPELFEKACLFPQSTVIPSKLVTLGVLRYLGGCRDTWLDSDEAKNKNLDEKVAILREANTGYGVQSSHDEVDDKQLKDLGVTRQLIDLPFPISISQLAAASQKDGKPGVVLPHTDYVGPKLPVRDQNQLDAVPPFDPETAAATAGQSLREIMTTIERARVRYVGIVATDARDVVFLAKFLRTNCPNVRVFTTEPSIAFLHPDDAVHLRGMVVGSTYPLAPAAQSWARTKNSPHRIISFPSQSAQGYYNAVVAQFEERDKLLDNGLSRPDLFLGYRPPKFPAKSSPSEEDLNLGPTKPLTSKEDLNRPPIWISIVGQGGHLVPVHCYTKYSTGGDKAILPMAYHIADEQEQHRPVVPVSVGVLLGSLGAVAALAVVILALTIPRVWQKGLFGLNKSEVKDEKIAETVWVWVWRGVMLAGILLFALPYAIPIRDTWNPCCRVPEHSPWRHDFVFRAAYVIVLETIFVVGMLVYWGMMRRPRQPGVDQSGVKTGAKSPEPPPESRWGYLALAAVVLVATVLAALWGFSLGSIERFFLYVRTTDLTAGMSPVIPMGLLGVAVFVLGFCGLRQADLSRRVRLDCPYPSTWTTIRKANRQLITGLKNPCNSVFGMKALGILVPLFVPFLVFAFWTWFEVSLPSDEGPIWDRMMRGIFLCVAGAMVFTLVRFLVLWSRLGKLLGEIVRVPMVGAFERLPDEIGRLFGGYLYAMEVISRRHRAVLAWMLPERDRGGVGHYLKDDYPELASAFQKPLANSNTSPFEGSLTEYFRRIAHDYLHRDLPAVWINQSVSRSFGASRAADGQDVHSEKTTKTGPERAVAIQQPAKGKAAKKERRSQEAAEKERTSKEDAERETAKKESFVAAYIVLYVGQYFAQLRQLVWALVFVPPLLLFAAASYPFQPDRPWLTALMALLGAVAGGIVYVLYRVNRDGLISRITRTTPGRFTPDQGFMSSLTTYVLPIIAVLALQLLGLFRFVVDPILGLLQ